MKAHTKHRIRRLLVDKLEAQFRKVRHETEYTPFVDSLFGKENIYTAFMVQSFYTTFKAPTYEQIAMVLAEDAGWFAQRQVKLRGSIDPDTAHLIDRLCSARSAGKPAEVEAIRKRIQPGLPADHSDKVVDIAIRRDDGSEFFVDIVPVKSSRETLRPLRKKMLIWAALRLSQEADAKVETYIGVPYNRYHPADYARCVGYEGDPGELRVQEGLWNMFAGYEVYADLLAVFADVGDILRQKIEHYVQNKGGRDLLNSL